MLFIPKIFCCLWLAMVLPSFFLGNDHESFTCKALMKRFSFLCFAETIAAAVPLKLALVFTIKFSGKKKSE